MSSTLTCSSEITSRHVTSRHVTSRHVTSRHVTSRHVTSRHVPARYDDARAYTYFTKMENILDGQPHPDNFTKVSSVWLSSVWCGEVLCSTVVSNYRFYQVGLFCHTLKVHYFFVCLMIKQKPKLFLKAYWENV